MVGQVVHELANHGIMLRQSALSDGSYRQPVLTLWSVRYSDNSDSCHTVDTANIL